MIERGLLTISASRPTTFGLELRLLSMHELVQKTRPAAIVVDPVSNLVTSGSPAEAKAMLTRLVDFLKNEGVTTLFTNLTAGGAPVQETEIAISSLIDTWILVRDLEAAGERHRSLSIIKSRGMAHSNQARAFVLGRRGIALLDRGDARGQAGPHGPWARSAVAPGASAGAPAVRNGASGHEAPT